MSKERYFRTTEIEIEVSDEELAKTVQAAAPALAAAMTMTAMGHIMAPQMVAQLRGLPAPGQLAFQTQGITVQMVPQLEAKRDGQDERADHRGVRGGTPGEG